jgi:hypothetical protein
VGKLRLLVGGKSNSVSPTPVSARLLTTSNRTLTGTGRRAIPMPGDHVAKADSDDGNFRNF